MSVSKPIRLFRGALTGRVYATRSWREHPNGVIECTGQKFDVTDEVLAIADQIRREQAEDQR